jgi:hypothetical protein
MKPIPTLTVIYLILLSWSSAQEITKKQLNDVVIEIPGSTGGFSSRDVSKVEGVYRDGELFLLRYDSKTTLTTPEGTQESESTFYFVISKGRKLLRIGGTHLAPAFITSPWPIHINHISGAGESLGDVRYNISIPDIGFFEYLEFKNGKMLPPLEGEEFQDFKKANLDSARKLLSEKP